MNFEVKILFDGFSGKLSLGYLGWGSWALVQDGVHNIMLDTGNVALRHDYDAILARAGVIREQIDTVLLTHLHFDHACNVDLFPNATFYVSQAEWDYGSPESCADTFVQRAVVEWLQKRPLVLLQDGDTVLPNIRMMLTPGHTPGSCCYLLDQGEQGCWALAGDAVKNRGEIRTGTVQMSLNAEVSEQSIAKIKAAATRVLPGHDGWITIKDGEIIAEGGNDKTLMFGQGVTVNGGQDRIVLRMD